MPRGRPRLPGTEAERAEARRAKVRQNVQAFRARQKTKPVADSVETESSSTPDSSNSSIGSSKSSKTSGSTSPPQSDKHTVHWITPLQQDYDEKFADSPSKVALVEYVQGHQSFKPSQADSFVIQIPISPNASPEYRKAFLAALYDRFHPDTSSSPRPRNATQLQLTANIPCSSWVEAACYMFGNSASTTLAEATLAAALAVIGAERSQQEISIESLRVYLLAMKKIRSDLLKILKEPDGKKRDLRPIFLASFACSNVEFLCNNNLVNMLEHIKGMGSLIQRRGVQAMQPPDMRILLYEFRVIDNTFSIMARKPSFLCLDEWINTPWRDDPEHRAIPTQTLYDVAYLIPPLLEDFDKVQEPHGNLANRLQLLPRIQSIMDEMDDWAVTQVSLIESDPDVHGTESPSKADDYIWSKAFAYPFRLLTWSMAAALITWLPYKIMLLDMSVTILVEQGTLGSPNPEKEKHRVLSLNAARDEILQCAKETRKWTPHFLEQDKKIVGWIMSLFPFQTAYFEFIKARQRYEDDPKVSKEELHELDEDIQWCLELSAAYAERGFKVQMLELSSQVAT